MSQYKILWLADYSHEEHKGGSQQTNKMMVDYGKSHGFDIEMVFGGVTMPKLDKYDAIISNNITKWEKEVIRGLRRSKVHIRYEHDNWVANNIPDLYKEVSHTVFLSPLHRKNVEKIVGYNVVNSSLVSSPIDVKKFRMGGQKEENSVLWCGNFCHDKGSLEFMDYAECNKQMKFYVAGWGSDIGKIESYGNMEYLGELDVDKLAKEYQRCEYFYHRPIGDEAFGRAVVEAYLCGCNLLVNDIVGVMSWNWDFSDYESVRKNVQSESRFWQIVKDCIEIS